GHFHRGAARRDGRKGYGRASHDWNHASAARLQQAGRESSARGVLRLVWPRDRRSYRVALVADRYLNPPKGGLDAVPILLEAEWGAIQLPADDYPSAIARPLLEQVAEQVEEFHRRGYDTVVVGR